MIETDHAPAAHRRDKAPRGWLEIAIVVFLTLIALVAVSTARSLLLGALGIDSEDAENAAVATAALLVGQIVLDFAAVGVTANLAQVFLL